MLQAILDELKLNKQFQIVLLLDPRFTDLELPNNCAVTWVKDANFWPIFEQQLSECDAVLPIAPEQDDLLSQIAACVKAHHKQLWLSEPETVQLCTQKLQTLQVLAQAGLPVVATQWLNHANELTSGPWVIKPNDSMGCQGSMITDKIDLMTLQPGKNLIVQPYIEGDSLSLSTVFIDGTAYLLSCNRQHIRQQQQAFSLAACTINIPHPLRRQFVSMVDQIAAIMPGLWGYIGIDLIVSPEQGPLILEINTRLTTSYVGLYQATGISPHLQLFNRLNGRSYDFTAQWNESIDVYL